MNLNYKYYLIIILLQGLSFSSFAQKATLTPDSSTYLIGDWINLSLDLQLVEGQSASWPTIGENFGELEVLKVGPIDSNKEEHSFHQYIQLIAFDTGFFPIPALQFYIKNNGVQQDSVQTTATLIEVKAVPIDSTSQDIKPIKDVLPAKFTWKEAIPWLIGLLIAIVLLLSLYYFYKKSKSAKDIEKIRVEPEVPAHEWALGQLAALEQKQLWQKERIKDYYSELTDILRGYIERRWKTPAMESTTEEIKGALNRIDLSKESRGNIGEVLFIADLVKFAKSKPLASEHNKCADLVKQFIIETKQNLLADE